MLRKLCTHLEHRFQLLGGNAGAQLHHGGRHRIHRRAVGAARWLCGGGFPSVGLLELEPPAYFFDQLGGKLSSSRLVEVYDHLDIVLKERAAGLIGGGHCSWWGNELGIRYV